MQAEHRPSWGRLPLLTFQGATGGAMKKISNEEAILSIPDLYNLCRELSRANELRHAFWSQLRAVQNQAGRYITAHQIDEEEITKRTVSLAPKKRKFYRKEWETGREIPLDELHAIVEQCNILHRTSQLVEELKRKNKKVVENEPFFFGSTCAVCHMPLTGRQKSYCSDGCKVIAKSRRWRKVDPERKREANYKHYEKYYKNKKTDETP